MDAYKKAKAKLFTFRSLTKAVINKDDEYAVNLERLLSPDVDVKTFGFSDSSRYPLDLSNLTEKEFL